MANEIEGLIWKMWLHLSYETVDGKR